MDGPLRVHCGAALSACPTDGRPLYAPLGGAGAARTDATPPEAGETESRETMREYHAHNNVIAEDFSCFVCCERAFDFASTTRPRRVRSFVTPQITITQV